MKEKSKTDKDGEKLTKHTKGNKDKREREIQTENTKEHVYIGMKIEKGKKKKGKKERRQYIGQ